MYILEHTFEEYLEIVRKFHGAEAPGVMIGGFMVDVAVRNLPEGVLYEAICETRSCLPDAIQLLTPCTTGNSRLKIIHSGRFALTLHNKTDNKGVRVFLDAEKVQAWQAIKTWYFKLKPKKEQDPKRIAQEIKEAGDSIVSVQHVRVTPEVAQKKHKGSIAVCPKCREAYPAGDGETCLSCQGSALYVQGPKKQGGRICLDCCGGIP